MTKKKKKVEELLEESLVPKDEQLCNVDENWIWVRLDSIAKFIDYRGKTPKKTSSGVKLITAKNVKMNKLNYHPEEFIAEEDYDSWMTRGIPNKGDILITTEAPLGNVTELDTEEKVALAQRIITLSPYSNIYNKYLKFILQSPQAQLSLLNNSTGTTVSGIKASKLRKIAIPLPPLAEQKRIAEKVERLLNKVEESEQLIEEAKETFELRRAAILDKAFRGDIKSSKNGSLDNMYEIPEDWVWKSFDDVAKVASNLVEPNSYKSYPHIAPNNIEKNTGRLLEYETIEEAKVKSSKHLFYKGQIIYSKIRPYLSKVIVAEFDGLCSADMYPIETSLNTKYLYWYMLSPFFVEKASTAGSRSVLPKINQKELGKIHIPVPPEKTQNEIVGKVEKLLKAEWDSLQILHTTDETLKALKQSILFKAFRGELRTNDPSEESAIEFLEEVLKEQVK